MDQELQQKPAFSGIDDLNNLSFEAALEKLNSLVAKLESGQISIEDSVAFYEQGVALKNFCEQKLKNAEMKIEKIRPETLDAATGNVETEVF